MVFIKNKFQSTAIGLVMVCVSVFGLTACASQSAGGQRFSAAAAQQTLGALQVELNQTATAEKNGLIQQATALAQTQTAAVTPLPTGSATPTPDVQKTQQMSAVLQKIEQYAKDKYLPSTDGAYQRLSDQTLYFADAGKYKSQEIGLTLADFAYESDVSWENSTETTHDFPAGCGFVFHSDGANNFSMAYVGLDGNVYMNSVSSGQQHLLGKAAFGKVEVTKGNAHIALLVSGAQITMLVNGKLVLQENASSGAAQIGRFAYLVYSGSSDRLGTACKFSNIDLWTVKSAN